MLITTLLGTANPGLRAVENLAAEPVGPAEPAESAEPAASGSAPPGTTSSPFIMHTLPDAEFLAALAALQDGPDEVLYDPESAVILLPSLRADCRAAELCSQTIGPKLSCPVTAFAATRDWASPP
jgi:surfactin synthase thioesterase subunit